jgi:AraC-like DNA-binding protein
MSPAEKKKRAARQSIRQSKRTNTKIAARPAVRQPTIVKTSESATSEVHSITTSRYALGYVLSGHKYIYMGDLRYEATRGDIFFLSKGTHYIAEAPDERKPFEEIIFYYTPEHIGQIVAHLGVSYGADTCVHHTCEECLCKDYVIASGWKALKSFFVGINQQIKENFFEQDSTAEMLSLTSLVYHIVSRPEGCLRTRVLGSTDPEKELMERQINEYVFSDITLEEFAMKNNRSLSSFKKKFKSYFGESPHRWVVRQRLMHARQQLISTNKSVTQIGAECRFPNTSHFIKLFREEFGLTPALYRRVYLSEGINRNIEQLQKKKHRKEPVLQP